MALGISDARRRREVRRTTLAATGDGDRMIFTLNSGWIRQA